MAKTVQSNQKKKFNLNVLIRNGIFTAICVLGMCGSLKFYNDDLEKTKRQLEEKPIGSVFWKMGTIGRLMSGHVQWERLEKYSSVYSGDIISTASFSGIRMNLVNGETLELSGNTSIHIEHGSNDIPKIDFFEGYASIKSGRTSIIVNLQAKTEGRDKFYTLQVDSRSTVTIIAAEDFSVKILQGSAHLSYENKSHTFSAGMAFDLEKDVFELEERTIFMLNPRDGTRILRTSAGEAPVKFQWINTQNEKNVTLEFSDTKDFSKKQNVLHIHDTDTAEINLSEGTWYWFLQREGFPGGTETGRLDIIVDRGPRALSPANGSTEIVPAGRQSIDFYWVVPEDAEAVLLEVADNPEMLRPRIRQLIRKTGGGYGAHTSSSIGAGKWYWRVHPIFSGGVSEGDNILSHISGNHGFWRIRPENADVLADDRPSSVNSFTIREVTEIPAKKTGTGAFTNAIPGYSPQIVYPDDNFTIESSRTPDIVFTWRNPLQYRARFQIAERSDFAGTLIADEWVFGSSIRGIFLNPGVYYWHITGTGPAGESSSSPMRLLVESSLAAPKLNNPGQNEKLNMAANQTANFSWQKTSYADYYQFRIFLKGRPAPLAEVSSLENTSLQITFDPNTSGDFRWTVQGFTNATQISSIRNGLISEGNFSVSPQNELVLDGQVMWSIPRIVNIKIQEGDVLSPITLVSPAQGASISGTSALRSPPAARWNANEPIRNAQLIISSTPDPSSDRGAIIIDASDGSGAVFFPSLKEGTWYWIIKGDTIDSRGATSAEIFWLTVHQVPQLPAPRTILPENNSLIGIEQLTREKSITFRWESVEDANSYIFSLYRDSSPPVRLVNTEPDPAQFYIFSDLLRLSEGDYYWQVEAVSKRENGEIEQRGKTEIHPFKIVVQRSTNLQTQSQGTMYGQQ